MGAISVAVVYVPFLPFLFREGGLGLLKLLLIMPGVSIWYAVGWCLPEAAVNWMFNSGRQFALPTSMILNLLLIGGTFVSAARARRFAGVVFTAVFILSSGLALVFLQLLRA